MHVAVITTLLLGLSGDSRRWEDEVVYVVIIEKFSDGDPSNNFMKRTVHQGSRALRGRLLGGRPEGRHQ